MKLSNIGLIIGREYSTRVKKKSFILLTVLTPLLMAAMIAVPVLISLYSGNDKEVISIADSTGLLGPYFENDSHTEYRFIAEPVTPGELRSGFDSYGSTALVYVSPLDRAANVSVISYSREPLSMETKTKIGANIGTALRDFKLKALQIENFDEIMERVKTDVRVDAYTINDSGEQKKDSVEMYMVLAYVMSFLIYMFVFMFGSMVMRGVIEEKSNRIVEVIVSSVNSFELMMGKIIGVALVAVTQFAVWVLMLGGLMSALSGTVSQKMPSQVAQIAAGAEGAMAAEDAGPLSDVMSAIGQLGDMDLGRIIASFLIYFLLGYLLYAAMFAAVGSAVDNEADTNQLSLPITIPLMVGLFIMLHTFQHPNSSLSVWASIIPFTSPMVMLARIPFGVVPAWQLILSIALLIVTFVAAVYLSAKIYKVGILTYGKKATFKDLWNWVRYKE